MHEQPKGFIIDTGSPVTIIQPIFNAKETHKTSKSFVDVNENPIKIKAAAMVKVKTERSKETLPIIITEDKNKQPLLGLAWLDKLELGLQANKNTNVIRNINAHDRCDRNINEYEDLF